MQHFWIRTSLSSTAAAATARRLPVLTQHTTIGGRLPERQTSKCISSVSFVRIESKFFLQYTGDTDAKMMDQNFEIRILIFGNFLNDADATFLDPHISVVHCCCSDGTPAASTDAAHYDRREVAGTANFKMYLLRQFCSNRVKFFLQYTGDTDAKMMDQNFEIRILIFGNFLKFSKRRPRRLCVRWGSRCPSPKGGRTPHIFGPCLL